MTAFEKARVKAGDTVTATVTPLGDNDGPKPFDIKGEVYVEPLGDVLMLGAFRLSEENVTLTDHQPAPEPEWLAGDVADITVHPSGVLRAVRARTGNYWAADTEEVYSDDDVEAVTPLVVIDPATVRATLDHFTAGHGPLLPSMLDLLGAFGIEAES